MGYKCPECSTRLGRPKKNKEVIRCYKCNEVWEVSKLKEESMYDDNL